MKNKKIIERKLPLTNKYKLLSIARQALSEIDVSVIPCDNCGASIVNIATIQDKDGKKFSVGLDCMETLTKALVNLPDYEYQKYAFNSALRFYALLPKAEKVIFRRGFVTVRYTDKKGNPQEKSEFEQVLTDYNFDLTPFRKPLTQRELQIEQNIADYLNGKPFSYTQSDLLTGYKEFRIEYTAFDGKHRFYQDNRLMRCMDIGTVEKYIEKYTE